MTHTHLPTDLDLSIADVQALFQSRQLTVKELVEASLERIRMLDQAGPQVNSVIQVNPQALEFATGMDAALAAGTSFGPLHGIPILLKDNIDTGDQMQTTAGSLALLGAPAPQDAAVAARLRDAGALILGKTNLSEWANFRSTRSVSGWSSRGGQTRNPHALDRNPSGSSSGSGAAVAACFAMAALGTETDGSITSPASASGIVGFKPTVGLVSRRGIIPISHTQDTAGPMTRSVADAALLLDVLAGQDAEDGATQPAPQAANGRYAAGLNPDALKGKRLGVVRHYFGKHPLADQLMEEALSHLSQLGAILVDPVSVPTMGEWREAELEVLLYEFKAGLNRYLITRGSTASVNTLADVIIYNHENAAKTMPFFGQELLEMAQEKGDLTTPEYQAALATCRETALEKGLLATLALKELDALIGPSWGPAWLIDPICGDQTQGGASGLAAVAGSPHLTLPLGEVHGLPVNLSFMGAPWADGEILALGYAYEQAVRVRIKPYFRPSSLTGLVKP